METTRIFVILSLLGLVTFSTAELVADFCVANLSLPVTPTGYPCKDLDKVTVDDFVFSGLGVPGNTSNIFKVGVTTAFDKQLPGLNGLGLSMARLDIGVGGVVPLHTHRVSEVIVVIDGPILAGFMDDDHTAYYKTLNKGDIMVFPPSLLHFQVNVGETPALAFVSLNSANPGFQTTIVSLIKNDLPSDVIEKITLLDYSQVKKLKNILGGTNVLENSVDRSPPHVVVENTVMF